MTIKYQTIQDLVYLEIRKKILSGELRPGQRISQLELATALGVSRMPVREALRSLESEGLVNFYPHRGAVVSIISLEEFEEIYRIREDLELLAVEWCSPHLSELDITKLRRHFNRIKVAENHRNVSKRVQAVRDFHFEILQLSNRSHLLRLINGLWDLTEHYRRIYSRIEGIEEERLAVFANILHACEMMDADGLKEAYKIQYATVRKCIIEYLTTNINEYPLETTEKGE